MDGADQKYWVDGQPYQFVASPDDATGGDLKYWSDGAPYQFLMGGGTPPPTPPSSDGDSMFLFFL